jgi:hypothetical protein
MSTELQDQNASAEIGGRARPGAVWCGSVLVLSAGAAKNRPQNRRDGR